MKTKDMVLAQDFCAHHNIELTFIQSLNKSGLIDLILIEEKMFLPLNQLSHLEKFIRFYYEMDINVEGIETINYLLQRMDAMQKEIVYLNDRLKLYENTGRD